MALHTVSELKDSAAAMLSGIDLSNVDALNACIERGASTLIQKADIPEASGIQNITLYAGVTDYAVDPTIFGAAINDIRPQGISRIPSDFPIKTDQETFDRTKDVYYPSGTMSTFEFHNGVPLIRIVSPYPKQQIILDQMNAIGNSPYNWIASGTASNLVVDSTDFYQAPASLRFNVTGVGTGVITKTPQSPFSMASYQGVGTAFLAIQIPPNTSETNLATVSLKLGSDSANYNLVTVSTGYLGAWTSGEWLLVSFDFSNASTAGTPNWSNINYIQVLVGTLGTINNFRIGNLFMSLPTPAQILYQSAAIFLPVGSSIPLETITDDTDTIILTRAAYTLLQLESAIAICEQTGGSTGSAMIARFESKLNGARARNGTVITEGLYDLYRGDNPSQELRTITSWYDGGSSYNSGNSGMGW